MYTAWKVIFCLFCPRVGKWHYFICFIGEENWTKSGIPFGCQTIVLWDTLSVSFCLIHFLCMSFLVPVPIFISITCIIFCNFINVLNLVTLDIIWKKNNCWHIKMQLSVNKVCDFYDQIWQLILFHLILFCWLIYFRSHFEGRPYPSGFVSFSFRIAVQNQGPREACKILLGLESCFFFI